MDRFVADRFEAFWQQYPRKVAKAVAEKKFAKLNPSPELLKTMMAALEIQKKQPSWLKDGGQFVPYPGTWLGQQRWADAVTVRPTYTAGSLAKPRWYDTCTHDPACGTRTEHELRVIKETP